MRRANLTRRGLLRGGVIAGAAVLAPRALGQSAPANGQRPRNIIFMVADGMSIGALTLAQPFSELTRGRGTTWHTLLADASVSQGWYDVRSLNSLVTDSSASSSAWGSGTRIFNDAVNLLPDGTKLTPIAELVQASGRRVGLVTTTTVTHATPAGFAACQKKRDDEQDIAPQYLDRVDVVLGGGREFFLPELRADKRDLAGEFRGRGYDLWTRREDLLRSPRPKRALGIFGSGHLPFTIDRDQSESLKAGVPTLAEMARAALEILAADSRGFLLQVEGGRVDHAAHSNDAAALLWEMLAFDDALQVAQEFAGQRGDTLVVVTTDHGNANPGLNGMGSDYRKSTKCFERLAGVKASYAALKRLLEASDGAISAADVREACLLHLGIELSRDETKTIAAALDDKPARQLNAQFNSFVGGLGQVLSNHTGIGWTGTTHTADLAPLLALGPGKEGFVGIRRNTDAFVQMTALFDIRHRNPSLSPEEARKFARAAPPRMTPHWV